MTIEPAMISLGARLLSQDAYRENPRRVWRRLGYALAASVAVHAAVFTELPHIGQDPGPSVSSPPLSARIAAAPPAVANSPAAKVPRVRPPRPRAPARESAPVDASAPAPQAAAEPPRTPDPQPVIEPVAVADPPRMETAPAPSPAPAAEAPLAPAGTDQPATGWSPEYAQIDFDLSKGEDQYIGRVTHVWQRNGAQYEVRSVTEASGLMSLFFSGRLVQESKGTLTERGLRPDRYTVQRGREDRLESAAFDWEKLTGTLAGRGTPRNWALQAGTQDQLSFLYQLAFLVNREGSRRLTVTNARSIDSAAFEVLGEEAIRTGAGDFQALHVRSQVGTEGGTVEVWLATQHQYLPVKIRLRDKRGEQAEQVASAIRMR